MNKLYNIVYNKFLSKNAQIALVTLDNTFVKSTLAEYDYLCEDAQVILSNDSCNNIKWHLATNPNLIKSIQLKLYKTGDERTRKTLISTIIYYGSFKGINYKQDAIDYLNE